MATLRTLARPYADAVFTLSCKNDTQATWHDALATLHHIWCSPGVAQLLSNPQLSHTQILDFFSRFDTLQSRDIRQLITVLIEQKRLPLIPEVYQLYLNAFDQSTQTIRVKLTSAKPLNETQTSHIEMQLKKALRQNILLSSCLDPNLIAGFTLQYHDKILDRSTAGRLQQLKIQLNEANYAN